MSQLFIPSIGDRLTIVSPWSFDLYLEHRNISFAKVHGHCKLDASWNIYINSNSRKLARVTHTMEPGTVLECDRIYIKSTSKSAKTPEDSYDSITWKVVVNDKPVKAQRFWVKLADCNGMTFDPYTISKYHERKQK